MRTTLNLDDDVSQRLSALARQSGRLLSRVSCEGFMDRWTVSFNGCHTYTVVEPLDELHNRIPVDQFRIWQEEWPDNN